ncbi:MAG: type transport system ATP-binding protein [Frankiales bacterium]|jgi:ABC-2 type transport system ATP-binding protein|nr:type transport system ATP-binding protein [Frankiales bacterium]
MTEPVVVTHGLTKRYGQRTAVDGLDMHVPAGVVAGFIGANGAGKTTTLRMLLGLVRPSEGTATVLGHDLGDPSSYLRKVGALIESPAFYPGLSGERNLKVQTSLGGIPDRRIPEVLEVVGLADRGRDAYKSYSLGMKQRLGIASALLGEPELLVLDEPTNGLDPTGIRDMRELLRQVADTGLTVLVSSHQLVELEQVCDWLVMVDAGRQVFQGTTSQLLAAGSDRLVLATEHPRDLDRLVAIVQALGALASRQGRKVHVPLGEVDDVTGFLAGVNRAAMAEAIVLVEIAVTAGTLEDRYASLVGAA